MNKPKTVDEDSTVYEAMLAWADLAQARETAFQELAKEFRRLAAEARAKADAQPKDHFSRATKYEWVGTSNTYLHAAQMLEERLG